MLNNIKPILLVAQIFGGTPYKIFNNNLLINKKALIYSFLVNIISLCISANSVLCTWFENTDVKYRVLSILRTVLGVVCLSTDTIITSFWNHYISSAINNLCVYDLSAKFHGNTRNVILNICRIVVILMTTNWIIVGYLTYLSAKTLPHFNAIGYCIFYIGNSMQVLKFCGFILLVYQRFDHLSHLVQPTEHQIINIKIINHPWRNVKLQNIWSMHCNLSTAAEKINCVFSIQLLLWLLNYSLNALSRIYSIINNEGNDIYLKIRDILCVIGFFINLLIIILPCHFASRRANEVIEKVFSPTSVIQKKTDILKENNVAIAYFCAKKVSFTAAAGFIHINLPLLISIFGAMTTYLVILHKSSADNENY
ncbi:hypothetical protein HCN44_006195 [Aphidius gifuensis]|uniref:Gustatory receptor n=1 Tax=Aphidius gifuensis TaxID=684658 RepID=A0A835CVU3_APHGI|nr:hypothetical protein HCN44_006195 [Aphidius gifuensis]